MKCLTGIPDNFWAITCYFNPVGYERRLANYRIFRERLAVPLITVESSGNGHFDLRRGDADILIQLKCTDLLWQKERLLNIALESLPRECKTVAWLDCDVILESNDWAARTDDLLGSFRIVFPYKSCYELPKDGLPEDADSKKNVSYSFVYAFENGIAPPEILRGNMRVKQRISSGGIGAARRDMLDRHGFYDACVMGSGNRALACASFGRFDDAICYLRMSPEWAEHYLAWARPFFDEVRGKVSYLNEGVFHLWHGDLKNRQYAERHELLASAGFDPAKDLVLNGDRCWAWAPARSNMQRYLLRYFQSRREDG